MTHAEKIRSAAEALHTTIVDAQADGVIVDWPRRVHELPAIAISEGEPRPATVAVEPPKHAARKKPEPKGEDA